MTYTQHFQLEVKKGEKKETKITVSVRMFIAFWSKERTLAKQRTRRARGWGAGDRFMKRKPDNLIDKVT